MSGFQAFEQLAKDRYDEIVMPHRATGMIVCPQQHHRNRGEAADPTRTGADHLGFRVTTRAELD